MLGALALDNKRMKSSGDQAQQLRQRRQEQQLSEALALPSIAITGGKGGVGKTCIAVNLSIAMQQLEKKSLLVDLDLGLANADILLGLNPHRTLFDVVLGNSSLDHCKTEHRSGLDFIPAASGREELTRLSHQDFILLMKALQEQSKHYDISFLDTAAGISREVTTFLRCSKMILVVITPDPTSMTDAYALIKILEQQEPGKDIAVIVNQVHNDEEGLLVHQKLNKVCKSYIKRDLRFLGHVPQDRCVVDAVRQRRPFIMNPDSRAGDAIRGIAVRLKGEMASKA